MKSPYQVCAACIHFQSFRAEGRMIYRCSRLGFGTKPDYSFDCWSPKESVKKLMEKRGDQQDEQRT